MNDIITCPSFSRLTDYCGLWSMSPVHFSDLCRLAQSVNWQTHEAEPLHAVTEKIAASGGKNIALVRLTGLLMKSQSSFGGTSTINARREIRQAAADPDVGAILLAIDSPGGTIAGTDDLATDIRAARRQKAVWAHVEDLGASAAYWAASQASHITANSETALVGSIGTLQVIHDVSAAAEAQGVRTLVFRTGPLKGLGSPGAKVTDEQIEHVQALVDAVQSSFDAAVQKGRNLGAKELKAVRHGGVMTATEALEKRLIDGIQPLSKTITDLTRSLAEGGKQRAIDTGRAGVTCLLPITHRRLPVGVSA